MSDAGLEKTSFFSLLSLIQLRRDVVQDGSSKSIWSRGPIVHRVFRALSVCLYPVEFFENSFLLDQGLAGVVSNHRNQDQVVKSDL